MKLPVLVLAAILPTLCSCDHPSQHTTGPTVPTLDPSHGLEVPQSGPTTDLQTVSAYFSSLGSEPVNIPSTIWDSESAAAVTLRWLWQARLNKLLRRSREFSSDLSKATPRPSARFSFYLSTATLEAPGYALTGHRERGLSQLEHGKIYVQFRFMHPFKICPSYYGIVDPAEPTLLSYFKVGP